MNDLPLPPDLFPRKTLAAIHRSIAQLRIHGREPVRIRINPDDLGLKLFDLPVVFDDAAPPGEPAAEWDPFA